MVVGVLWVPDWSLVVVEVAATGVAVSSDVSAFEEAPDRFWILLLERFSSNGTLV